MWDGNWRYSEGNVKFAATKLEKIQISPTMVEAMALRWCLQWILASDQNGNFLVEMDVEVVVKCIQGVVNLAVIENIILDCNDILSILCNCYVH